MPWRGTAEIPSINNFKYFCTSRPRAGRPLHTKSEGEHVQQNGAGDLLSTCEIRLPHLCMIDNVVCSVNKMANEP